MKNVRAKVAQRGDDTSVVAELVALRVGASWIGYVYALTLRLSRDPVRMMET